jgi:flagellar biogenesis protein FliO
MRQVVLLTLIFMGYLAFGYEVENVAVTGQDRAQIEVAGQLPPSAPAWKVQDNVLEVSWPNTKLASKHGEKLELSAPHALIKRVTLLQGANDTLKGRIVINGSMEAIRERMTLSNSGSSTLVSIDYPTQNGNTMKLLQEEQTPIAASAFLQKNESAGSYRTVVGIISLFLLLCVVGGLVFFRFFKGKGALRGARRYLIEQLSYCPLGAKSGVSLLKIGTEFVLVGITPNQISMLSQLPKLQEQYEEETGFERGVFQEAVAEEVQRLR